MENVSFHCYTIFVRSINDYHVRDNIDAILQNPYAEGSPDSMFYEKNWIDTIQWHLEDMIRDPDIPSDRGLYIKRRIDRLNQKRTDIVELIDEYFQDTNRNIVPDSNARHNTESVGWAIDRLSILALKEFHVYAELSRKDASIAHVRACRSREAILLNQKEDLLKSINWLIEDIRMGKKINKVYKQLKMYNDDSFNPILYNKQVK
jgi:hypothetical protein